MCSASGTSPHARAPVVDRRRVFDRPRRELSAVALHHLRAVDLRATLGHAYAVEQARVVRGRCIAAVDRDLEVLERAPLQTTVGELRDEPRGMGAVLADEPDAGPRLEVVEHGPEPIHGRGIAGTRREHEQLVVQPLVVRHSRRIRG